MGYQKLADGRSVLPKGVILQLSEGMYYKITDEPIGFGGASILYPAVRVRPDRENWIEDELRVALKECYPLHSYCKFERTHEGQIIPSSDSAEGKELLNSAKDMMRKEKSISGSIYNRSFRLTPIWAVDETEKIAPDGRIFFDAQNCYGIMERLDGKGIALGNALSRAKGGLLTAYQSICVVNQVLQSLEEVHASGYLHGDVQENNIFIKGSASGESVQSGSVSLIDFGSARKLMQDGASEVIRDKSIFSTKGYVAPECLLLNDGTLRLTRAADIYSVGYLMLRMLTGKKLDERALRLVVNGKYVFPRQAKKIGCPSESLDAVNKILSKSLKQDPAERYQNAGEMLLDTKRLEEALSPRRSAIASVDYDAFISYCHEESSILAAEQIQIMLERYKIPKSIRNLSGKKRMGKVFYDRGELASSSDVEHHLKEALAHSEYLIVLLGPGVPDSPWVSREIELFLETHGKDKILTVLVEGEIENVFPEILRSTEKFAASERGGFSSSVAPVEGLAADIRARSGKECKKKLKTEIYRLLAPMLGCSFDDLRQRQKEYRSRHIVRIMSAAVAALCVIAGYTSWQAHQIHENYMSSLKKQSRYLAEISSQLLTSGDRIKAIEVAMEALPEGENDDSRPLIPEAEAALNDALYSYQYVKPDGMTFSADRTLNLDAKVYAAEELNSDGTLYLTIDESGTVYVWNIDTGECIQKLNATFFIEHGASGIIFYGSFVNENDIVLISESNVVRMNAVTGAIDWIKEWTGETVSSVNSMIAALSEDGEYLAVYDQYRRVEKNSQNYTPVMIFSTDDGENLYTGSLSEKELPMSSYHAEALTFSPDGSNIALAFHDWYSEDCQGATVVINWREDTKSFFLQKDIACSDVVFVDNTKIAVLGYHIDSIMEVREMMTDGAIQYYDLASKETLWRRDITVLTSNLKAKGLQKLTANLKNKSEELLLCWCNRNAWLLDLSNGELINSITSPSGIVGADKYNDNYLMFGMENGSVSALSLSNSLYRELDTNVECDTDKWIYDSPLKAFLLVSNENCSVAVLKRISDDGAEELLTENVVTLAYSFDNSYRILAVRNNIDDKYTYEDYVYSIQSDELVMRVNSSATDVFEHDIFMSKQNPDVFYIVEYGKLDGDNRSTQVSAYDISKNQQLWSSPIKGYDDRMQCFVNADGQELLMICLDGEAAFMNLANGTFETLISFEDENEEFGFIRQADVSADGSFVLLLLSRERETDDGEYLKFAVCDLNSECIVNLPAALQDYKPKSPDLNIISMCESENYAALYDKDANCIYVLDLENMEICSTILFNGSAQREIAFLNGSKHLLLWGDDGYLKLWDVRRSCVLMEDAKKLEDVRSIQVDEEGGAFAVYCANYTGYLATSSEMLLYNLTEGGSFSRYASVQGGFCNMQIGEIGAVNDDNSVLLYRKYSLDELLEKAREIVGEGWLSEAEKIKYFIAE